LKLLQVKARPGARASTLVEPGDDGVWTAQLKAAPVDGKANHELIGLVAARFGVPRSRVTIRSGAAARLKRVQIDDEP
jgi:uncharacterized protein